MKLLKGKPLTQNVILVVSALLVVLGIGELGLRLLGFGQGAIYVSDPDYEYMHAPNQRVRPFGHLLITNKYGMRSRDIDQKDDVRVLVLGDSVINGGNPMPHDALATTILEKYLQSRFGPHARALNISAGSWGPDNAAAFLHKHGLFGTHAVIAVFSSHDIGDIMTHEPIVGLSPAFEDSYPKVVLWDTLVRYVWPRLVGLTKSQGDPITKFDGVINQGWQQLIDICAAAHIPFHVVLHKERREFQAGDFNPQGHALISYLRGKNIEPIFETGFTIESYRDSIHLSAKGHADLATVLEKILN